MLTRKISKLTELTLAQSDPQMAHSLEHVNQGDKG